MEYFTKVLKYPKNIQIKEKVSFLVALNGLLWCSTGNWEEKEYMNNCMICLICLIVTQVHSQYHRHWQTYPQKSSLKKRDFNRYLNSPVQPLLGASGKCQRKSKFRQVPRHSLMPLKSVWNSWNPLFRFVAVVVLDDAHCQFFSK